ncbi:MAG: hypothetical protein Q8O59_02770 [bacterium]|nr:hypothetical protein [bacterium]
MFSTKQLVVFLIISGFIFTGFGYLFLPKIIGQAVVMKASVGSENKNNTFAAGMKAAYDRLIARGRADIAMFGYGYQESKIIDGKIKEIKDGQISLDVYPINPLADPALDQRIIKVDETTKIYKQAEKTAEQIKQDNEAFNKQMAEFNQKMKEQPVGQPPMPPRPPEPFGKQEIKLTDLKVGDQIMITAEDDIHAAKEFTAEEISVQFSGQAN